MSRADVWAEDSDPDSDNESRKARIALLGQKYNTGLDLFIMSASIKGELKTSPWARKRKRKSQEEITGFFSVKKILQPITTQLDSSKTILPDLVSAQNSRGLSPCSRPTPIWDQVPPRSLAVHDPAAKPTARVIDFKEYETQALSDFVTCPTSSDRVRIAQTILTRRNHDTPERTWHSHPIVLPAVSEEVVPTCDLRTRQNSQGSIDTVSVAALRKLPPQAAVANMNDKLPSPDSSPYIHEPQAEEIEHVQAVLKSTESSENGQVKMPDSHEQQILEPSYGSNEVPTANLIMEEPILMENDSDRFMLNTQAELASAQLGLAEALHIEDHDIELSLVREERPDVRTPERQLQPIDLAPTIDAHEGSPTAYEVGINVNTSLPIIKSPNSPSSHQSQSPAQAQMQELPDALLDDRKGAPAPFTHFGSPTATQSSFLAFGSPLTFTPEPGPGRSSNGTRQESTIDDIQKYLNDSNFDAAEEARRLMEEETSE